MAEIKVYPNVMINCPLRNQEIPEEMCYEINMVIDGYVKKSFVPEVTNWNKAKDICPNCPVSYYRDVRKGA